MRNEHVGETEIKSEREALTPPQVGGGGGGGGGMARSYLYAARDLVGSGSSCISCDYRLAGEHNKVRAPLVCLHSDADITNF